MNGLPTLTKTKTRTKVVVAVALLVVAGAGALFAMAWQKRLIVRPPQATSLRLSLPNLVIDSVTIEEPTRIPTVVVRNAGERTTDDYFSIKFSWYDASGAQTATINLDRPGTTLAPGETDRYGTGALVNPTGSTSLTVTVDFNTRIRESNDDDNIWTGRSFTRENAEPGFCTDGADNDADGTVDMYDTDCADPCDDRDLDDNPIDTNRVLGVDEGCATPGNLSDLEARCTHPDTNGDGIVDAGYARPTRCANPDTNGDGRVDTGYIYPEICSGLCNNCDDDGDHLVDEGCDRDNDGFCRVEVDTLVYACHRTIPNDPNDPATVDCRDNDVTSYPGVGC